MAGKINYWFLTLSLFSLATRTVVSGDSSSRVSIVFNGQIFAATNPDVDWIPVRQEFEPGYFVELTDATGCSEDLLILDYQQGESNINNLYTYVSWYGRHPECDFDTVVGNLHKVNINYFILVIPYDSSVRDYIEERPQDPLPFVVLSRPDEHVQALKERASKTGSLEAVKVEYASEPEESTSIPMSSMAILFVTVAFVTLMTVSIGWLVFYYAQRCRQRNMRERLQSRLCVAAKRAVSKLPTKTVPDYPKSSKKSKKTPAPTDNDSTCSSCSSDDGDFCPVCLDLYKPREIVRILPCKHEFHKSCVDPWLFDHRTCPMCKLDILEHLGMPAQGDRLGSPAVAQAPEPSENVSTRVDQEVQTDFVNPSQPPQNQVIIRISEDSIEPDPISIPSV